MFSEDSIMKKLIMIAFLTLFLVGCQEATTSTEDLYNQIITITAEQGKSMIDGNPDIILVDVRTTEEYALEHIPGAINLDVDVLLEQASTVLPDQSKIYILYCRSGNRSHEAAFYMLYLGYPFVYDMGGIIDWPYETVQG